MRRKKALVAAASVAALTLGLAACGGSSDDDDKGGKPSGGFSEGASSAKDKDPTATGPAPEVEGAKTGGEITVLAPDPDDGPTDLDPASLWSVTANSIAQDLLFRSLTQFRRDAETGQYVLVPDLATDLGTPNDDFTEWRFTLKDGIKWENGDPVTADEVAFGIKRSFDEETFPTGPGTAYSNPYFLGGTDYTGPYTGGADFPAVTVEGNDIVLKMAKPFSEMDYYGIFPAIGPVPLDAVAPGLRPRTRCRPAPTRSRSTRPTRSWCWSRTTSGTPTPTRRGTSTSTSTRSSSTRTPRSPTRRCSVTAATARPRS